MKKLGRYLKQSGLYMGLVIWSSLTLVGCGSDEISAKSIISTEEGHAMSKGEKISHEGVVNDEIKVDTDSVYNRQMIKTGEIIVETEAFSKTLACIIDELQALKGHIETIHLEEGQDKGTKQALKRATLAIRVPQEAFDTFINNGNNFGKVIDLSCQTEDVTERYIDTQLHIDALKTRYHRLLELMEEVDKYEDLFKFEEEIAQVEYEINKYEGTLNQFDSVIEFSQIDMIIKEVEDQQVIQQKTGLFGEALQRQLTASFQHIRDLFKAIGLVIIGSLPYIIVLGPIGIILWKAGKRIRNHIRQERKRKLKNAENKEV